MRVNALDRETPCINPSALAERNLYKHRILWVTGICPIFRGVRYSEGLVCRNSFVVPPPQKKQKHPLFRDIRYIEKASLYILNLDSSFAPKN